MSLTILALRSAMRDQSHRYSAIIWSQYKGSRKVTNKTHATFHEIQVQRDRERYVIKSFLTENPGFLPRFRIFFILNPENVMLIPGNQTS